MKNKETKSIGLRKLTIAKINPNMMRKINGGDCLPTEHCIPTEDIPSYQPGNCLSTQQVY